MYFYGCIDNLIITIYWVKMVFFINMLNYSFLKGRQLNQFKKISYTFEFHIKNNTI